ncbi:MAG TPA: protein kinase [Gemmatimonadales bacterium]|nr:protein kinase [Gemmatimonadales bacterium]
MARLDPDLWQAAQPLLDEVLDTPAATRGSIFARIRTERPEVARLVEALLAAEDVDSPTLDGLGLADVLREPPALGGQAIGPYTLERLLGEGGMGTVWLGRRSDGVFEGAAAIKLLHLGGLGPGRAERFQREATLLARLDHPNIARLLDAGVTPAGQPYLVLEHVDGVRLDRHCAERRHPLEERLSLFTQVCAAVSAAHRALIVHRDIKPANVLVAADGRVKLLDFGIAKLMEDSTPGAGPQTTQALTPEFASPEQVREAPVTTAADVYGLGLLLHLLLTGRHPTGYDSRTPADFLQTTLERDPMRASEAVLPSPGWPPAEAARHATTFGLTPGGLRRLLRGDLDVIIARALRKEPAERYASAAELADDIERHLTHQPVRARPESAWYLARKYLRRHRMLVGAAGLTLATLLGATWVTTRQMLRAERERDEAQVQRDRAVFEERRAIASSGFMQSLLATMGPSGERLGTIELLDRARELLERDYRADPRFVSRMMVELGDQYDALSDLLPQRALLERALAFAVASGDAETQALAGCALARRLAKVERDLPGVREHLGAARRALAGRARTGGRTHVECLLAEARAVGLEGLRDSALGLASAAVALGEASGDTASTAFTDALLELAEQFRLQQRWRDALGATRRATAILQHIGRSSTPQALTARRGEGTLLQGLGEYDAANRVLTAWVADARGLGSRFEPWVELTELWQARMRRDPRAAVALGQRRLERARRTGNPVAVRNQLWEVTGDLIDAGDLPEARARFRELMADLPPEDSILGLQLGGRLAEREGRLPEAGAAYRRFLQAVGFPDPSDSRLFHFRYYVLRAGGVALLAGDAVAAESLARHSLRISEVHEHDRSRSGDVGRALLLLGQARVARADTIGGRLTMLRAVAPLRRGMGPDHAVSRQAMELLAPPRR